MKYTIDVTFPGGRTKKYSAETEELRENEVFSVEIGPSSYLVKANNHIEAAEKGIHKAALKEKALTTD